MIIDIFDDKIFGEGDDGTLHRVMEACCLKIPHDNTYDFQVEDRLYVKRLTDNQVEIVGEEGVTVNATGTKINRKNDAVLYVKVGANEWDEMFGNLVA